LPLLLLLLLLLLTLLLLLPRRVCCSSIAPCDLPSSTTPTVCAFSLLLHCAQQF
jgi:hypothetical protein